MGSFVAIPHTIDNRKIFIAVPKLPAPQSIPAVYLLGAHEAEKTLAELSKHNAPAVAVVGIESESWDHDFSPWQACGIRKGESFTGGAQSFIRELKESIIPYVESSFPVSKESSKRMVAGYSLAGLCALYALTTTNLFAYAASMSGSLWFPGWNDFCKAHPLDTATERSIYLSLGNKEKHTKNPLMAQVEECTKQTENIFTSQGAHVHFEMDEGNHFTDVHSRIAKGIAWCAKEFLKV